MQKTASTRPARGVAGAGGRRIAWWLLAAIVGLAATSPWWPLPPDRRWGVYCGVEVVVLAATWLVSVRRRAPGAWWWLLAGFSCNVVADLLYYRETVIVGMGAKAAFSDVVYVFAYVPLLVGLVLLGRRVSRDAGALLDASIFAVGLALPAIAFYILPAASQTTITLDGMLLLGWYALGSILVFALYVRQLTARRSRNPAFLVLGAALLVSAIGDTLWNVHALGTAPGLGESSKLLWFLNRSLLLVVIVHPSVRQLWLADAGPATEPLPRIRLLALTLGSLMPAITLLLTNFAPVQYPYWIATVGGGLLLPVMVLLRMDGLVQKLRGQARQLDLLSHYDELTGAPNRRHWNRELAAAAEQARLDGTPLALAVLDLDRFKEFNDSHGHHAGDDLLREAYAAWSDMLPDHSLLARHGGEEFALLLPGATATDAARLLARMQRATPCQQTFSAGVTVCDVDTDLANALDAADAALYAAKQSGRNRIRIAGEGVD